jgi:hypothetical protein
MLRLLLLFAACETAAPSNLGPGEIPLKIAQRCPGDPNCPDSGDGKLYAGVARRVITPTVEPFTDLNGNNVWDDGEPFTDMNGNGKFDPVYLAGRDNNVIAFGVADDVWVRAWAIRTNATTIAFFTIDALGLFRDPDIEAVRAMLPASLGIDLVVGSSTHGHHNADLLGQWGPDPTVRGTDDAYLARLRQLIADAITEAVNGMKPAKMRAGSIPVVDGNDETKYVSDTRDPVVIDNVMHVLQFDGEDGTPIVTVVNWASHPDSMGSHYRYVSSDFVHYFREAVEAQLGDPVVFVNAAVGGQIGPGHVHPLDENGMPLNRSDTDTRFIEYWGKGLAEFVPRALAGVQPETPKIAFRTTKFAIHVDNIGFQTLAQIGTIDRMFYGYDRQKPLIGDNAPLVDTEMAYLQLGDNVSIITMPGELLPELFIGGYHGEYAYNWQPFIDTSLPNAADPTMAPKPPYLRDLMPGQHRIVWGLAMDFFGYIVPQYNYVLDPVTPYLRDAPGDHYEETNSVGPRAEPEIVGTARQLVLAK